MILRSVFFKLTWLNMSGKWNIVNYLQTCFFFFFSPTCNVCQWSHNVSSKNTELRLFHRCFSLPSLLWCLGPCHLDSLTPTTIHQCSCFFPSVFPLACWNSLMCHFLTLQLSFNPSVPLYSMIDSPWETICDPLLWSIPYKNKLYCAVFRR